MQTERYSHGHHESVLRAHTWRTAENSVGYLLPHLRPGASLLDVGAGPGTITVDLARRLAPGRVVGVDASADVVAQAQAHAAAEGVTNVTFATADAYRLDAADGSFDIVHTHQLLQHLARPVDALREFRRVAGPDGLVAAREVDYAGIIIHPHIPALDDWLDLLLRMGRTNGGEPSAGRRLKAWARAAGFADVAVSASTWLFETDEQRAWWGGSWADRALHSSYADHALEQGIADRADLERISAGWREWAASEDGWLLMPHGEILARG
ncbi:methyltransferase domain-containing protein [Microbacterium sp. CnD16-F]|uniref:methyltransferase domain-containing protein n=1 Tax=unclassified Microbacterium TaxID=2609290 RepID=UPI002097C5B8|nr:MULTISPECIES: methyltransferase domain-containing protein [unclassified Microbacterium]MCO7202053.1 methyltransferase domain-containing protein [Microbacterium sp. CnD16-F]MDT0179457.1 methyltransferase domain-containing protein [Microbacterium sp. ARD31]